MKIKWKENKKEEKKRKEAMKKRFCTDSTSRPSTHRDNALPLGYVVHTEWIGEILLLKPSSLIKREFKDIFQKNDCSFDSENPT